MCPSVTHAYKLNSDRLYLEPVTATYLPILHEILTNEFVRKYLCDDQEIPISQSKQILETALETFAAKGYGLWLVYVKDEAQMIGLVGLYSFFSEPQPQLLYALLPQYTNKGYATEASREIIRYAFQQLGYSYLVASCDAPNTSSIQVMERLGMKQLKEEVIEGKPLIFYQINR